MSYYPDQNENQPDSFPIPEFTCLERLKMELGHSDYCEEDEFEGYLNENGLYSDLIYNKDSMQIRLLETVISVLEMLGNNLDNYMRVETNFLTQTSALDNIHKRIAHIQGRIDNIRKKDEEPNGNFSFMFHTHKKSRRGE